MKILFLGISKHMKIKKIIKNFSCIIIFYLPQSQNKKYYFPLIINSKSERRENSNQRNPWSLNINI